MALGAQAVEAAGHTGRVARMAVTVGQALGLDEGALEGLRHGAYLHDIGKLAVPGALTADEEQLTWSHSARGAEIAAHVPWLGRGALEVIRHHPERWDGLGYPDGLRGKGVPLAARVFAVYDVYDALTSERPGKHARSLREALAEIEAQAGKQFDPALVIAFLGPTGPFGGVRGSTPAHRQALVPPKLR